MPTLAALQEWLFQDPTGKKVGAAALILLGLSLLYLALKSLKFAAQNFTAVMLGAAVIGGGIYAGIHFQIGWVAWMGAAIGALFVIGAVGFALTMSK